MCAKHQEIELPFDIVSLASDLKEIKTNLDEAIASSEDCPEEIDLLLGVVESLQGMIKGISPDKMDRKSKISLLAHFTLFQELVSTLEGDDFDDEDFEDEEEEEEEEEGEE
ncbi:MAG: hypothetical protein H0X29_06285 [Parachlamydiaceae bacterium]|nr:hypothetical protein [Parachlamydiaceae bacterium]